MQRKFFFLMLLLKSANVSFSQTDIPVVDYFKIATSHIFSDTNKFKIYLRGGEIALQENNISADSPKLDDSTNYYYAKCIYFAACNNILIDSNSFNKAFSYVLRCANSGKGDCQLWVGYLLDNGLGCIKNTNTAIRWYLQAANKNIPAAMCNMALLYYKGGGVNQNYDSARMWYLKAASENDNFASVWAMAYLGDIYKDGKGVKRNFQTAIDWYTKAASKNNDYAMYNLGMLYLEGRGIKKNIKTARDWFKKAAEFGHEEALEKYYELEYK